VGQRFVAEVPVNFAVRDSPDGPARRADERLTVADAKGGQRYRQAHQTVADSVWRATTAAVWVVGRDGRRVRHRELDCPQREWLELNRPPKGAIRVSNAPLRKALDTINH
jgi:hypothetical protein